MARTGEISPSPGALPPGEGSVASLPPLPVQYADFAAWQQEWLAGPEFRRQVAYWERHLAGAPPVLALPTEHARPAVQSYAGAVEPFTLPAPLVTGLRALARREGVTLFMIGLAAFQALLARYTGQTDIVVGAPVAARARPEVAGLIGFFANTLVLRTDLGGNPTGRELLARVRDVALNAYAHQDVPFEKLVEQLQPARDPSHSPLVQVMFAVEQAADGVLALPGLRVRPLPPETSAAKFDLTLALTEGPAGLSGGVEYNTDLFAAAPIRRLIRHFQTLLAGLVADPDTRLADLPLLTPAERRHMLVDWNARTQRVPAPPPAARAIHELFEAQVERTPEAVAASAGAERLTYAELNARANRLAYHLQGLGVGPETPVGICLERSLDLLVGLLGILKAGGAYLPLDPRTPAARRAGVLADAGARILVTHAALLDAGTAPDLTVVCLDADHDVPAQAPATNPPIQVHPEHPAYILYTSGSTGKPKGVVVPHRALVNHCLALAAEDELGPADRVLQFAAISFDVAAEELYPTWARGARVMLCPPEVAASFAEFRRFLAAEEITVVNLPTPYWHEWVADLEREAASLPPTLRLVVVGSDRALPGPLARWRTLAGPGVRWLNAYGPTEATITCTVYDPGPATPVGDTVPIGCPIANAQAYVLDRHLHPVPVGVPGDLYIGGAGLARGYLGRPDLTAERFIPHPFSATPGARLYATGDQARYRPDGTLDFLGRRDEQVKIRGFRIELGEVEAALVRHPAVQESVVVALEVGAGERRLVGYVVPHPDQHPITGQLRDFLAQALPDYMIPAAFVLLDALPLLPTGKLDRRALPAPSFRDTEQAVVLPRTPTEEVLAGIWAGLLHQDQIGVQDNFFQLGGHSLLATQVVSRLRDACGVEVPVRLLFEAPTVAGLAAQVDRLRRENAGPAGPPPRPTPRDAAGGGRLPLSFAQQRLWFLAQLDGASAAYNVPAPVRLSGPLDLPALEAGLTTLVQRHEILRTTFPSHDGQPVQVIAPACPVSIPLIDLESLPDANAEAAIREYIRVDAVQPFDLARGPLWRATLVRRHATEHVLLLTLHHIIVDGASFDIFWREWAALYAACRAGEPAPLPALPIQYADFAVWQREWLQGAVVDQQLAYWKERLGGGALRALPALQMPTDRPRPAVQTYRGAEEVLALPAEVAPALQALSREAGATLFMAGLATYGALLARYTGQTDLVIGTPIANRAQAETIDLIGFFANTLALRLDLTGDPSFAELLRRVREVAVGAYAHQDLPFEKLVAELQPPRDPGRTPLFQTLFALRSNGPPLPALGDAQVTTLPIDIQVAKFDLNLTLHERDAGLLCRMVYNTDLFDAATIRRLLGHFATLLGGIVAAPSRPLSTLPLLTEAERRAVAVPGEAPRATLAAPTVTALFEAQAARTPTAPALVYEDQQLTYGELNARANQLAHQLRLMGVGPDVPVGLYLERSPELIAGLLGILKAGGAYLPLDAATPPERVAALLAAAGAPVLVTQADLAPAAPAGIQIVCLDGSDPTPALPNPAPLAGPANLVYVIYTSGSTGAPKGVAVEHRQLLNYLAGILPVLDLAPGANCALVSTLAADLGHTMLFPALGAGGCLHLVARARTTDARALAAYCAAAAIDYLKIVPSHLRALLAGDEAAAILPRHTLVLGGEATSADLVAQIRRLAPGCRIVNHYGPTETTVGVLTYPLPVDVPLPDGPLPLGRPLAGSAVYVLDGQGRIVPPGVPGEIYIGGAGVARGYLGRPAETALRFVPDPFGAAPGGRLYRTGDQGRTRPDGTVEFLGRVDNQVKIRGYRVEPGEVEAVLRRHPGVGAGAVVARRDEAGQAYLAAYVTGADGPAPADAQLRDFLARHLPVYMIPAAWVALERLPLTANGKIDYQALLSVAKDPAEGRRAPDAGYDAPRSEIEHLLIGVWQQVLNRDTIGVHDDYFALGGDSMRVIQIVHELQKYGLALGAADLLQHPTVQQLARRLTEGRQDGPAPVLPLHLVALPDDVRAGLPAEVEDAYPLAAMQEWMIEQMQRDAGRQGVYHVQHLLRITDAHLAPEALEQALNRLVQKHPVLRTRFYPVDGGRRIQAVHRTLPVTLVVDDLQALGAAEQDAAIAAAMQADRATPFNVDDPALPLLRFRLFRRSPEQAELLMAIHHALSDGWGHVGFLDELLALYTALRQGTAAPGLEGTPPTPNSYKEFVALEQEIRASDEARAFWRTHLAGQDFRFPPRQTADAPTESSDPLLLTLDRDLSDRLAGMARELRVSLKAVYLSAYLELVAHLGGAARPTVGVVTNGRSERLSDPFKALGLFWNLVPVPGGADTADAAARIRQVQRFLVALEPYARYPLAQMLADQQAALFFAAFNFLHFHNARSLEAAPAEAGVRIEDAGGHDRFHFPLTFVVAVHPFTGAARLRVEHDPQYFPGATLQAATARYLAILEGYRPGEIPPGKEEK